MKVNDILPFGDISDPLLLTGDITEPLVGECGTFALKCRCSLLKTSKLQIGKSNLRMLDRFSSDDDMFLISRRCMLLKNMRIFLFQ